MEVFPSPKFQLHPVILPVAMVDKSVKQVGFPRQTTGELKFASGRGYTVTTCCIVSLHPEVATSVTVYVPGAMYVWVGLCKEEKFPSPKFQFHEETGTTEVAVNVFGLLKQTLLAVKDAPCGGMVTGN